jgi:hypothetical protein
MTVVRESFVLPGIFLTVALLGGLRIAQNVRLMPPSLMTMVLALLLLGCLVRSRALIPEHFLNSRRTAPENLSGLAVLLSLFVASAQVFNLISPESGLLYLVFSTFFLVQLLTTLAAVRARIPLLQALLILLGSAFLIRFVALEGLYSPDGGMLQRVLIVLMEGASLGSLDYQPHAPVTGYVAFATLALFMTGLFLLAPDDGGEPRALEGRAGASPPELRDRPTVSIEGPMIVVLMLSGTQLACSTSAEPAQAAMPGEAAAAREAALASARVWRQPAVAIPQARLGANPPGGWQPSDEVACNFVFETVGGTTPKFNCQLPDGQVVKIKYGRVNEELYTEVAASRLLSALGFGSDRMFVVRGVKCSGCPTYPFVALRCAEWIGLRGMCLAAGLKFGDEAALNYVAIERPLPGRRIEAFDGQGWAWYELEKIDPARGGSPLSEVDALRLLAVILAHWDNKSGNQRLICPPGADRPDGSCAAPFAFMHDVGATFGPTKLDLVNWRRVPVWKDPRTCTVSMRSLPWNGATFPDRQISEGGRQMLLGLIDQLSAAQLEELFTGSRMTAFDAVSAESRDPREWVRAFQNKVRQLREAGPCPNANVVTSRDEQSHPHQRSDPPG